MQGGPQRGQGLTVQAPQNHLQILLLLRGEWHCGSVYLGGVWFGCRNRYTAAGLETEGLTMPDALFARLRETEALLSAII